MQKVLSCLKQHPGAMTFEEILKGVKRTEGEVRSALGALLNAGRIKMVNRLAVEGRSKSFGCYRGFELAYQAKEAA